MSINAGGHPPPAHIMRRRKNVTWEGIKIIIKKERKHRTIDNRRKYRGSGVWGVGGGEVRV